MSNIHYHVMKYCEEDAVYLREVQVGTLNESWIPAGHSGGGHTLSALLVENVIEGKSPHVINLRPGDGITDHDANFSPVETLTGSNISRFVHTFDYATPEFLRHEFTVPDDIDPLGNVKYEIKWFPRVPPVATEDVRFEVESIAIADGENQDQALVSKGTVESSADQSVDEVITATLIIPVSTLDWEGGDTVVQRFSRDADHASDTMHTRADTDDDALVQNIRIEIDRF